MWRAFVDENGFRFYENDYFLLTLTFQKMEKNYLFDHNYL